MLGTLIFGLSTPSYSKLMSGPLPTTPKRELKSDSFFKFLGNVGVGIGDSVVQGTRFVSNIASLDIGDAFKNIAGVVSKDSIDSFLVEFVTNLPEVLENNLHLRYKSDSGKVFESYFLDRKLDAKETAAVFNYLLSKKTPAEQKEAVAGLKNVLHLIKDGGNLRTPKVGQILKESMKEAIAAYEVEGVATTLPFGRFVLDHPAFVSGDFDTHFVQHYYSPERVKESQQAAAKAAAQLALRLHLDQKKQLKVVKSVESSWNAR